MPPTNTATLSADAARERQAACEPSTSGSNQQQGRHKNRNGRYHQQATATVSRRTVRPAGSRPLASSKAKGQVTQQQQVSAAAAALGAAAAAHSNVTRQQQQALHQALSKGGSNADADVSVAQLVDLVQQAVEDPEGMKKLEQLSQEQPDLYAQLILEVFKTTQNFSLLGKMPPPGAPDFGFGPPGLYPDGLDYEDFDYPYEPDFGDFDIGDLPPPDFDYVPDYDYDPQGWYGEDDEAYDDGLFDDPAGARAFYGAGYTEDAEGSSGSWVTDDGAEDELATVAEQGTEAAGTAGAQPCSVSAADEASTPASGEDGEVDAAAAQLESLAL